jgi:hypothetical protein
VADPLFIEREVGNYELSDGSPCIDSGRGIGAPAQDILERSRYDDLGMPNRGAGYPSYVDMGAFEGQEDTTTGDLAITYISNPTPELVIVGDSFDVEWTVSNVGLLDCTGPWQDLVYLSDDPYISNEDLVLEMRAHQRPLTAGESYTETFTATTPSTPGE